MKMIIIGAGATAYSEHANSERRPPLSNRDHLPSNELLRMFREPAHYIPAFDRPYDLFFTEALKLYDNDIEELFTGLYTLSCTPMTRDIPKLIQLAGLLNYLDPVLRNYQGLINIFEGKLRMELQLCIGTTGKIPSPISHMPICRWHRKLASTLDAGDVVVNFNYDPIMSFAMLNEKKLSTGSFINTHIKEVLIPHDLISERPVFLLNPHGSFTWYQREKLNYRDKFGVIHKSEQYDSVMKLIENLDPNELSDAERRALNIALDPPYIKIDFINCVHRGFGVASVILPFKMKKTILDDMPHLKEEYEAFLEKIQITDTLYFVGKDFQSSDVDIASDIKSRCSNCEPKKIIYINPKSIEDPLWVSNHNLLFNANEHECYRDLESFFA